MAHICDPTKLIVSVAVAHDGLYMRLTNGQWLHSRLGKAISEYVRLGGKYYRVLSMREWVPWKGAPPWKKTLDVSLCGPGDVLHGGAPT
jgi:hypothetical protein